MVHIAFSAAPTCVVPISPDTSLFPHAHKPISPIFPFSLTALGPLYGSLSRTIMLPVQAFLRELDFCPKDGSSPPNMHPCSSTGLLSYWNGRFGYGGFRLRRGFSFQELRLTESDYVTLLSLFPVLYCGTTRLYPPSVLVLPQLAIRMCLLQRSFDSRF